MNEVTVKEETKLLNEDFPDPCLLITNNQYFVYSTQKATTISTINVPFNFGSSLMSLNTHIHESMPIKPIWSVGQNIWAPDVIELNGEFIMFFSCSYNSQNDMAIGIATASSLMGPFIPQDQPLVQGP